MIWQKKSQIETLLFHAPPHKLMKEECTLHKNFYVGTYYDSKFNMVFNMYNQIIMNFIPKWAKWHT